MRISLAEEMRGIDKKAAETYGLSTAVLMENAGHRTAEAVAELLGTPVMGKSVIVLAGSGNNGGDAFAAARHLANLGMRLKVFFIGDVAHFSPATAANCETVKKMGIEIHELASDRTWDRLTVSDRKSVV